MLEKPPRYHELPRLLLRTREVVISHFRPLVLDWGLTTAQLRVLRALVRQGELEPKQLCTECNILSSNIVGIINRLEAMTLVQRLPVPTDRRRIRVRLTEKGEALLADFEPRLDLKYQELAQRVPLTLMEETCDRLEQIIQALEAQAHENAENLETLENPATNPTPTMRPKEIERN